MKFPLVPDFYFESIHAIDLARLRARGVRLLLADLDNTLVPYGVHTPPSRCGPGSRRWTRRGSPCFCSPTAASPAGPSDSRRLWVFPYEGHAGKPKVGAFSGRWPGWGRAGGEQPLWGTRFFTDIWGGNRAGVLTLLVHPIQFGTVFRGLRYGLGTPSAPEPERVGAVRARFGTAGNPEGFYAAERNSQADARLAAGAGTGRL